MKCELFVDNFAGGGSRQRISHIGLRAVCLCRTHHAEAHTHENKFFAAHHIEPIKLDKYLCDIHNLPTEAKRRIPQAAVILPEPAN